MPFYYSPIYDLTTNEGAPQFGAKAGRFLVFRGVLQLSIAQAIGCRSL